METYEKDKACGENSFQTVKNIQLDKKEEYFMTIEF